MERSKKLARSLGTHLASGTLKKEMGVNGLANEKGHFTFHPYIDAQLHKYFRIICEL